MKAIRIITPVPVSVICCIMLVNLLLCYYANAQKIKIYKARAAQVLENEFNTTNLFAKDNYLILTKEKSNINSGDYLFKLYKLPELKFIGQFGRVGRGPNEFEVETRHNSMVKIYNDSIQLWLFELNKNKLNHITLFLSKKNGCHVKVNRVINVPV